MVFLNSSVMQLFSTLFANYNIPIVSELEDNRFHHEQFTCYISTLFWLENQQLIFLRATTAAPEITGILPLQFLVLRNILNASFQESARQSN